MEENDLTEKILRVVSGQKSEEVLVALTKATAVVATFCVKKNMLEEFAEEFKNNLVKAAREAYIRIAIVKMNKNG